AQQEPSPDKVPIDEAERLLSLQVALKISDLGSSAETFEVNRRWVAALQDEFFAQGDQEKAAGLPVSALMDRDKPGAASVASQLGWYSFPTSGLQVAIPLFYNFTRVFPNAEPLMSSAMATY
ncbi:phosphodiesterase, partial [Haematococcus lacustris]